MNNSATPPNILSDAERIAWLHEPVRLRCGILPWFLVRWLERALERHFRRFEQCLLALMELQRQGKLEPWPDAPEAAAVPRRPKYKMKSPPAAPARNADGLAVDVPPQAEAAAAWVPNEAELAADAGAMAARGRVRAMRVVVQRPAVLDVAASAICLKQQTRPAWGWVSLAPRA